MREDRPLPLVNKWEVLRDLAAARATYGLSDRDLSVNYVTASIRR